MATEAQKRARQKFVERFAYGLGRATAHAKHEYNRKPKHKIDVGYKRTRATVAFLVGLGKGISMRKKQQMDNEKRRLRRADAK